MTPSFLLKHALRIGSLSEVTRALSLGADPNCCLTENKTCILHACLKGHTEIALCLARAGADPWKCGENGVGLSAITEAARLGHENLVFDLLLIQGESLENPHSLNHREDQYPYPTFLAKNPSRWNALLNASMHRCPRLTEKLLDAMDSWPSVKGEDREDLAFTLWQRWMTNTQSPTAWMEKLDRILPFPSRVPDSASEKGLSRQRFVMGVLTGHTWARQKAFSWMKPQDLFKKMEDQHVSRWNQSPVTLMGQVLTYSLPGRLNKPCLDETLAWLGQTQDGRALLSQHCQEMLGAACKIGSLPTLKKLIQAIPDIETSTLRQHSPNLLIEACSSGGDMRHRAHLIQWLVGLGFDVCQRNSQGVNALHRACGGGAATTDTQMTNLLLAMDNTGVAWEEWHAKGPDGCSPVELLTQHRPELAEYWRAHLGNKALTETLSQVARIASLPKRRI